MKTIGMTEEGEDELLNLPLPGRELPLASAGDAGEKPAAIDSHRCEHGTSREGLVVLVLAVACSVLIRCASQDSFAIKGENFDTGG
jgi:hypothetical protein